MILSINIHHNGQNIFTVMLSVVMLTLILLIAVAPVFKWPYVNHLTLLMTTVWQPWYARSFVIQRSCETSTSSNDSYKRFSLLLSRLTNRLKCLLVASLLGLSLQHQQVEIILGLCRKRLHTIKMNLLSKKYLQKGYNHYFTNFIQTRDNYICVKMPHWNSAGLERFFKVFD